MSDLIREDMCVCVWCVCERERERIEKREEFAGGERIAAFPLPSSRSEDTSTPGTLRFICTSNKKFGFRKLKNLFYFQCLF